MLCGWASLWGTGAGSGSSPPLHGLPPATAPCTSTSSGTSTIAQNWWLEPVCPDSTSRASKEVTELSLLSPVTAPGSASPAREMKGGMWGFMTRSPVGSSEASPFLLCLLLWVGVHLQRHRWA